MAVGVALLALVPGALAASGEIRLETPDPVLLAGDLALDAPGGRAYAANWRVTGDFLVANATGRVSLYSWEALNVQVPGGHNAIAASPEYREEHFDVEDATLAFRLEDEPLVLYAVARAGGALGLAGAVAATGTPERLGSDFGSDPALPGGIDLHAPDVPVVWEEGWLFVGDVLDEYAVGGFPRLPAAELTLRGPVDFLAHGGHVTFESGGETIERRLGNWTGAGAGGPVQAETWTRLIFEGTVGAGAFAIEAPYGLGAPDLAWTLSGSTVWTRATGNGAHDGDAFAFEDATVSATGVLAFTTAPAPLAGQGLQPTRYEVGGDFATLTVDGAAPGGGLAPAVALVAAVSVLGLVASLLFEAPRRLAGDLLLALYTRVAPGDVLKNPRRRALYEEAVRNPGIHVRELHRRMGGAWGPLRFHLLMLRETGYVRLETEGVYMLVYPRETIPTLQDRASAIPNPVARALYDLLPQDGSPFPVTDIPRRLGVSRQLASYHLGVLSRRGLIRLEGSTRSRRACRAGVAATAAPAGPASPPAATPVAALAGGWDARPPP